MANQFQFEIVSPEKVVFGPAKVVLATVPGGEGDYGVMAGHAPLITTIRPGVIDLYEANDTALTERIFVAGGFAEVTQERCTVLAEEAVLVSKLDRATVEQQERTLSEGLMNAKSDFERDAVQAQIDVAKAKLQAIAA